MTSYLIDIIDRISPRSGVPVSFADNRFLIDELTRELDRFDPRDFAASVQSEFVVLKAELKAVSVSMSGNLPLILRQLKQTLRSYGGENSHIKSREFSYIRDAELRALIERDYKELMLGLLPSRSWKSAVILAGSILEAILYGVLTTDRTTATKANGAKTAPKSKGTVIPIDSGAWTLASLINVAQELQVLPKERATTVDQVVRDYRNFVHPQKEIRAKHECTEAEGLLATGALEGISNHFERVFRHLTRSNLATIRIEP